MGCCDPSLPHSFVVSVVVMCVLSAPGKPGAFYMELRTMYGPWDTRGWCYHTIQIALVVAAILLVIGLVAIA